MILDSAIGIGICLALVLGTNAIFVRDWTRLTASVVAGVLLSMWLLKRNRADAPTAKPISAATAKFEA